jgi:hypothetical protein
MSSAGKAEPVYRIKDFCFRKQEAAAAQKLYRGKGVPEARISWYNTLFLLFAEKTM